MMQYPLDSTSSRFAECQRCSCFNKTTHVAYCKDNQQIYCRHETCNCCSCCNQAEPPPDAAQATNQLRRQPLRLLVEQGDCLCGILHVKVIPCLLHALLDSSTPPGNRFAPLPCTILSICS